MGCNLQVKEASNTSFSFLTTTRMAAIPFMKLGVLLVKQATKPMSRAVKARAAGSERWARLCEFLGQQWHVQTTKLNLMVQGHRVKGVKPLSEQEAVQSGAELLSEGFVLFIGIGALILESRRSARAAAEKALQKENRQKAKAEALRDLQLTLQDLAHYSIELRIVLEDIERKQIESIKNKKPPPSIELPPIPERLISLAASANSSINQAKGTTDTDNNDHVKEANKEALSKVFFQTASGAIKWIGSIINGDGELDDEVDDESDSDE